MRTRAMLERAAARSGVRILSVYMAESAFGPQLSCEWDADDGWQAARFLRALTVEDSRDLDVMANAHRIREACGPRATDGDVMRAIFAYHQKHLRFEPEEVETFQGPIYTLLSGVGDCDDHANSVTAHAWALDLPAELVFLEEQGQPAHVFSAFFDAGMWQPAETTIAAVYGEPPLLAAKRLGIDARPDLSGEPVDCDRKPLTIGRVRKAHLTIGAVTESVTPRMFAKALLSKAGLPQTSENVAAVIAWQALEGGDMGNAARFNPLNTTRKMNGSRNAIRLAENVYVQAYTSWGQGLDATLATLEQNNMSAIRSALRASGDPDVTLEIIDRSPWGTHNYRGNWEDLQSYGDRTFPDRGALSSPAGAIASIAALGTAGWIGWRLATGRGLPEIPERLKFWRYAS